MFFLHAPAAQAHNILQRAEDTLHLKRDIAAISYGALAITAAILQPEAPRPSGDALETYRQEMRRQGNEQVFLQTFGPTGLLGEEVELATRPVFTPTPRDS